jgi:PhzF family phenazine biosynthesis protein
MRFFQVDVFAPRPGAGNPLAVVFDAAHLSDVQMQAIANWTNLAETTFVLPPTVAEADYRVRIFTTRREIAFAGHPSIGTAQAAIAAGFASPRDGRLVQECQAGLLPLRIDGEDGGSSISVRVPRSRIVRYMDDGDGQLRCILAGTHAGITRPALVEGGRRWWLAEVADEAQVRAFIPDTGAIAALAADTDSLGLCIFARSGARGDALVVRAFPLGVGIAEDPASGAANAAIAAFLDEAGGLGALGHRYRASQGREIGRDAELHLQVDEDGEVWVGGESHVVIAGRLDW